MTSEAAQHDKPKDTAESLSETITEQLKPAETDDLADKQKERESEETREDAESAKAKVEIDEVYDPATATGPPKPPSFTERGKSGHSSSGGHSSTSGKPRPK